MRPFESETEIFLLRGYVPPGGAKALSAVLLTFEKAGKLEVTVAVEKAGAMGGMKI